MRVRFGLHRDGLEPTLPRTAVGETTVGPQGFLSLLESDLGIPSINSHPSEALELYRDCLAECDDWGRFYNASFDVDPVGVARTLNDWRQRWYLHGWDGTFPADVEPRLGDMAAVESLAAERVPPGIGQRLRRILELLDHRRVQVRDVELLDHLGDLPLMWRRVVERFEYQTTEVNPGRAPADSDLGKLQALLVDGHKATLHGDGSVVVMHAFSRDLTAQATAEMLRRLDDPKRAVVIASRDGIVLDNAFERVGMPRAGFQHYSPFRAASQVLKLALALVWTPLDPHRLLQFLIHPVNPLPWRIRGRLAEAVASQPGIGGPAWQAATKDLGHAADAVEFWTTPERYDPGEGAPVEALQRRVEPLVAWTAARLATADEGEESAVYSAAYSQAAAMATILARLQEGGRPRIPRIELDSLVDEVTRSLPDASIVAQAGHVPVAAHPGNVTDPVDEVFWWDLPPARRDLASPWSRAERDSLAAAGVAIPSVEDELAADKRAWMRPVLNCRSRLVVVVHEENEGRHPLWGRIQEQFKKGWVDVALDAGLLQGNKSAFDAIAITAPTLEKKPLPAPRRWWRLGQPLPRRDSESYTSLNKICYYPHEWALTYAARLRGGGINDVADGPILKGSLAHRLFERFFKEQADWQRLSDEEIHRWLEVTISDLIQKEGAVLLENGRGVDRQQVVTTLEHSLIRLLQHLREAGVRSVDSELAIERPFAGGLLRGEADLVLLDERGNRAVIDAKWGSENYRQKEIAEGRHLQLAVYGFTLGDNDWPATGYYIVTTGNVVAPDAEFFPSAIAAGGETVEAVWQRSLVIRDWRLRQFDRGEIEVNAYAGPDVASQPPQGGLETRVEPDRFDEFRWLTGVAPFQWARPHKRAMSHSTTSRSSVPAPAAARPTG